MDAIVAVPAEESRGLHSLRSAHFGHARYFVLAALGRGAVAGVKVLENPPHSQGGCMQTVQLLASHGVTHVVASGMGGGPRAGFAAAGIPVHYDANSSTVGEAIAALAAGQTGLFGDEHACRGHE